LETEFPDDIEGHHDFERCLFCGTLRSRVLNGVIMITTKKKVEKNKPTSTLKCSRGTASRALPEYNRVTAEQYYPLTGEITKKW